MGNGPSAPPAESKIPVVTGDSASSLPTFSETTPKSKTNGNMRSFTLTTPALMAHNIEGIPAVEKGGNGSATLLKGNTVFKRAYGIPPNSAPGMPSDLLQLQKMVGKNNLTFSYSMKASGDVSKGDCWQVRSLIGSIKLQSGDTRGLKILVSSKSDLTGGHQDSGWIDMGYKGPELATDIVTGSQCTSGGCGCVFEDYGGFSKVSVFLKIDVTINMEDYCLTPGTNNLMNDFCYGHMSDHVPIFTPQSQNGMTDRMRDYLQSDFCPRNVKNGLDYFSSENSKNPIYRMCACNMGSEDYDKFVQSIREQFPSLSLGSINPRCLLPACVDSIYQATDLNGCPIPQCFQVVNISKSSLAGPVNIKQNSQCANLGLANDMAAPDTPITYDTETKLKEVEESSSKRKLLILVGIVIIIIVIAVGIYMFYGGDEDGDDGGYGSLDNEDHWYDKLSRNKYEGDERV